MTDTPPLKIAIIAELAWAFGRIFLDLKHQLESSRFKGRYLIDRFHWNQSHPPHTLSEYDVIYTCDFVCVTHVSKNFDIPREKICWGPHYVSGFWFSNPFTTQGTPVSKEMLGDVTKKEFPLPLVEWLREERHPIGCISKQMVTIMQFNGVDNVMHTRCGVNDFIVDSYRMRLKPAHSTPKVLLQNKPVKVDYVHGYDMKRLGWLPILVHRLQGVITFVWPTEFMTHAELDQWYDKQKGDICLCISHTEGNPLGLIEGIGRGMVPISTPCGVAPEIINDGVNGFLIPEYKTEEEILQKMEEKLRLLASDRELLSEMRKKAWETADKEWRWSITASSWATFFEKCAQQEVVEY